MSVIIYGPQGSGKLIHAARLAAHFRLDKVVDADDHVRPRSDPDADDPWRPADLYRFALLPRFKRDSILYLTSTPAPCELRDSRRVMSITMALEQVLCRDMRDLASFAIVVRAVVDGKVGIGDSVDEISARRVLERLGIPFPNQAAAYYEATHRALKHLGWSPLRRRTMLVYQRPITTETMEAARG